MRSFISLFALCSVFAGSTIAGTLRVPQDHATIQAAVNAAGQGDRVKIANGVYVENVLVPAGKEGLVIEGSGKTIVDARVLGAAGSGGAISVVCDDITVRRLTVRHGKGVPATGVFITGDDAVLDRVTALHCASFGIVVSGDRTRVLRCVSIANDIGISVTGDDTVIFKATVRAVQNAAIFTVGARARIESCRVTRTNYDGILAAGPDSVIVKNTIVGARHNGIVATGANLPTITKNVVKNVSEAAGIELVGATGGVMEGNRVSDVRANGIHVTGASSGVELRKNRVERAGVGAAGFYIDGNNCSFVENLARACDGDGFNIRGSFNVFVDNRALANDEDGFDVETGPTTLIENVALGNGAEGLDNDPLGSVCVRNRALGNRFDVANSGAFATFEDNVFASGGIGFLPQIDG